MTLLGPRPPQFPIGISDYRQLRESGRVYVDKTAFVVEVLEAPSVALLYPRPRRFGKSLNLSTLRYFLEAGREDVAPLFEGTAVWQAAQHRAHFQRYPVVYLTFKDIKATSWEKAWPAIGATLRDELQRVRKAHQLDAGLDASARGALDRLADPELPEPAYAGVLRQLSRWCAQATGNKVVLLVDEYDAPLHAAWQHGYWDEAVAFFRALLGGGLKDNPHLFRGVMTGILRVAKEGIFSGLNNLDVRSILHASGGVHFGFTEADVEALAEASGNSDNLTGIRDWYNGYQFGGVRPRTVYNPWSVLRYLSDPVNGLQEFWKNSSTNDLVRDLLIRHASDVGEPVRALISGDSVQRVVDDNIALPDLWSRVDVLWSLLTFSGYLTAEKTASVRGGFQVSLRIPNQEVLSIYEETFSQLLYQAASVDGVRRLTRALLRGDAPAVEVDLEEALLALSHHDFSRRPVEAIYQAFLVGLLVHLHATHRVTSNREAGFGRADVLIIPRDSGPGAVLELKIVARRETPEQAMERAVAQLLDRRYDQEVRAQGASEVHQFGVVFDGKRCWVNCVNPAD